MFFASTVGFAQSRSPTAINFRPFGTKKLLLKKQEIVGLLRRENRDTEKSKRQNDA